MEFTAARALEAEVRKRTFAKQYKTTVMLLSKSKLVGLLPMEKTSKKTHRQG